MRVGKGVAVITLEPIDDTGGPDDALAPEHGQIAVDRSEGEIGDIRLELRVDPFGGGDAYPWLQTQARIASRFLLFFCIAIASPP